jgi:Tfp pilus assembly protein PilO
MSNETDPKISQLPQIEHDKLVATIAMLRRNLPHQLELQSLIAKIRRAGYEAYRKEGFTEAQALELCKGS